VLDDSAVEQLRSELTPHQWRLLLKLGLCIGCEVALREAAPFHSAASSFEEFDYGAPFPEERE